MGRLLRTRRTGPDWSMLIAIVSGLSVSQAGHGQDAGPQDRREQLDRVIAESTEAIRLDPRKAAHYLTRGGAWSERGDFNRAIADYTEAIRLAPRDARSYDARGRTWVKKHDYRKAIADFNAAIELDPGNPRYFLARGQAWARQGNHAPAMADFDEAIRLGPRDAVAYITRAIEWEKDLKPDRALADYQAALALDPRSVRAYEGRGRVWRKVGEYAKVVANFAELARVMPDEPLGHRELAWILATCDQDPIRDGRLALREATAACELTKWADPACLEALAAACAEVGDFDAAVGWQTRALGFFNAKGDRFDRRLFAKKTKDAEMGHRLYRYKKRLPYYERPDQAVR